MNAVSQKFNLMTFLVSTSVTSSQGSASGATLCAKPDGPTTVPSGREVALASRSAPQASKRALPTNAISGPPGLTLSASAVLQSSLANKLQARSIGSILYQLTWKARTTPLGRQICALRASAARTSASDFTSRGWPTPLAADARGRAGKAAHKVSELPNAVELAGWPTPTTNDSLRHPSQDFATKNITLNHAAVLANGPMRLCSDGTLLTGSTAGMTSGGRLNPAHSRWLMRLPAAWDDCAPTETASTLKRQRSLSEQ